ncbi:MAG: twin-arginine translocation signal domain-containing protein, partial [Chloroflexia bacterium]|nr:twin-arginine translocation signal domain-containing protein [Chloroflexia bacterium]
MTHRSISRRDVVKGAGAGVATAVLGITPARHAVAQDATPAAAPTGELVIGKAQEAVGFDPALVTAASSFQAIAPVYEQLVRF